MHNDRSYAVLLAAVGIVYCAIFGHFLLSVDLMPFVMDANESYSSLVHAENMYRFGIRDTGGLTDEAYGPNPAAHPFVYTHQGNFPRLFALLIYALGATSIEAQTVVTTFTIGLLSILLAYHFLTRLGSPLFASLCCAIMMTDYLMVVQWQVVTYRVWHMFFFFAALLCVHYLIHQRRTLWGLATFATFVCLFYFEFVFAAFVATVSALYAACISGGRPRLLLTVWLIQGAGAFTSVAILIGQVIAYLGYNVFLEDLSLTFTSRNQAPGGEEFTAFMKRLQEFYDANNIVFWFNVIDNSGARAPTTLLRHLFQYNFQVYSPLFSAIAIVLFSGWAVSSFAGAPGRTQARSSLTGNDVLSLGFAVLLIALLPFSLAYQSPPASHVWRHYSWHYIGFLSGYVSVLALLLYASAACLWKFRSAHIWRGEAYVRALAGIALAALLMYMPILLARRSSNPIVLDRYSPLYTAILLVLACGAVAAAFVLRRPARLSRYTSLVPDWFRVSFAVLGILAVLSLGPSFMLARNAAVRGPLILLGAAAVGAAFVALLMHVDIRGGAGRLAVYLKANRQARTALLLAAVLMLLAGPLVVGLGSTALPRWAVWSYLLVFAAMTGLLAWVIFDTPAERLPLALAGRKATFALLFLGFLAYFSLALLVPMPLGKAWAEPWGAGSLAKVLGGAALALFAAAGCTRALARDDHARASVALRTGLATTLLILLATFIAVHADLYEPDFSPLWEALTPQVLAGWPLRLILLIAGYLAARLVVAPSERLALVGESDVSIRALWFMGCGLIGFAVVYLLSPGYVRTGYLLRYTPFAVFLVSVLLGVAALILVRGLMQGLAGLKLLLPGQGLVPDVFAETRRVLPWSSLGRFAALGLIAVAFAGIWYKTQRLYWSYLPPDRFSFFKALREAPFAGRSFVVNTYAAPVTTFTGKWAYYDPAIGTASFEIRDGRLRIRRDNTYLWLADKRSNKEYEKPDFFLCMLPADYSYVLFQLTSRPFPKCSNIALVERARQPKESLLARRVVAEDPSPRRAWAIVELDWSEDAPYLESLHAERRSFVELQAAMRPRGARVDVDYRFRAPAGQPEGDTEVTLVRVGGEAACPDARAQRIPLDSGIRRKSFSLPKGFEGAVSVTVTPRTQEKAGPVYTSKTLLLRDGEATDCLAHPMAVAVSRPRPDSILLRWQPPYDILQYEIFLRDDPKKEYQPIGNIPGDMDSYRIDTVAPTADYMVRIRPCTIYGCMTATEIVSPGASPSGQNRNQ